MLPITPARLAANQRNAQLSTGPRTEAGKSITRANALKHGMCAVTVSVENEAIVRERAIGVHQTFQPQTAFQAWVCTMSAIITVRLDRLRDLEKQIRKGAAWRAGSCWDDDQRDEAKRLGARLARKPEQVVSQLRRTPHGCDWLIERWAMLLSVADRGLWTVEQQALANDLLETPHELRGDAPGFTVDADGRTLDDGGDEAALARAQLAELKLLQERVEDADAIARQLAIADLDDFNNPKLMRCRRYERSLQNEFHRLCTLSQFESPQAAPDLKFPASIPAHFFDPPPIPTEASTPIAPEIPNEPIPPVPAAIPNEPIGSVPPIAQNEPTPPVAPRRRNEPIAAGFGLDLPSTAGMDPALVALLEADLPDPNSLDPAWCREFIEARLGRDASGQLCMPGENRPTAPGSPRIPHESRGTLADHQA